MRMRTAYALVALLICCGAARAEVAVSFPLEGHYRPGRYMPVHISASGNDTVMLHGNGSVPTEVSWTGRFDAVVPWLAVVLLRDPGWWSSASGEHSLDIPLKPLADDEQLVALAGDDGSAARALFPGKSVILIALDGSGALLAPAAAWEALDGVVLDAAAAERLKPAQIATLLAAGTLIAVRSDPRPDQTWPWERREAYWVLQHETVGPASPIAADAYLPTYDWQRGWPAGFRRQVLVAAILFSILALGITLWRSRYMLIAFAALSVIAVVGFAWWYRRQSPVLDMTANIWVRDASLAQRDHWKWESAMRPVERSSPSTLLTRPVFASMRQIEQTHLRLVWSAPEESRFSYHLDPSASLAFLNRSVWPSGETPSVEPGTPRLTEFVRQLYLGEGERMIGQVRVLESQGSEMTVLVERIRKR